MAAWTSSTSPRRAMPMTALSTVPCHTAFGRSHPITPRSPRPRPSSSCSRQGEQHAIGRTAHKTASGRRHYGRPFGRHHMCREQCSSPRVCMHHTCGYATRDGPRGRIVRDSCVVYKGQEDVEPAYGLIPLVHHHIARAPSAANIRTAGTSALRVLTPTTAGIKLCVLLPTLFSNSI